MCTYTFGGGNQHNLSMVYRKRNMQQAQDISCTHKRCDSLTCIFRATNCGGSFLLPAVIQLIHWIRCTWEAHVCRTHGNPGQRYCTCQWTPNKQTIQMTVCGSTWCINWLTSKRKAESSTFRPRTQWCAPGDLAMRVCARWKPNVRSRDYH